MDAIFTKEKIEETELKIKDVNNEIRQLKYEIKETEKLLDGGTLTKQLESNMQSQLLDLKEQRKDLQSLSIKLQDTLNILYSKSCSNNDSQGK